MILIADSGASKTDWRIIDRDGQISQAKTQGFNPYLQQAEEISTEIGDALLPQIKTDIDWIYYYGAGCSSEQNINKIKQVLKMYFPDAEIAVHHDLLAAARALCGSDTGIACILGTGANSCLYNGEEIVDNVPALGYALGDEGSGAYIGKRLLSDYLRRDMPAGVGERLEKRFNLTKDDVLEKVYHQPAPSRYLASFAKFVFQNLKEPYLYRLVYDSMSSFFEKNVVKYEGHDQHLVHFTGGIAFYFGNILRQVANDKGIAVRNILESPIAGLTLYHQNQLNN
ncbi:MAG: N-acetylglucosamine kinase [Bacteroidota bacterium]